MKVISTHILSALLVAALLCSGCKGEARLIPRAKLADIYAEMYLSDQWLSVHPEYRAVSDSTLSYVPVLRKHGYTLEDYRYSVDHYLLDPERFAKTLTKVSDGLGKRSSQLSKVVARSNELRRVLEKYDDFTPEVPYYDSLFTGACDPFSIDIRLDSTLRYVVRKVMPDTILCGPELIPLENWQEPAEAVADSADASLSLVSGISDEQGVSEKSDVSGKIAVPEKREVSEMSAASEGRGLSERRSLSGRRNASENHGVADRRRASKKRAAIEKHKKSSEDAASGGSSGDVRKVEEEEEVRL